MGKIVITLSILLILILSSCGKKESAKHSDIAKIYLTENELRQKLLFPDTSFCSFIDQLKSYNSIQKLYELNNFHPLWFYDGSQLPVTDSLDRLLLNIESMALPKGYYSLFKMDTVSLNNIFKKELMLTDAILSISRHLTNGLSEQNSKLLLNDSLLNYIINGIAENKLNDLIKRLEPPSDDYQILKGEFAKWNKIPDWGIIEKLKDSINPEIKVRLRILGYYKNIKNENDSLRFSIAVKNYQRHHGLKEDGLPGKSTISQLNVLPSDRKWQILVNMERLRLNRQVFPERYILVNIPGYNLQLIKSDSIKLRSRLIIGDLENQTPAFESSINHIIVYPNWHVPYSIASKELLPEIQKDTGYIRKNQFEVFDVNNNLIPVETVNWSDFTERTFTLRLRQKTGESNALGVLKFNLESKYSIYLHDTNAKNLFEKEFRGLSHGCIRVERAKELAFLLLSETEEAAEKKLNEYIEKKRQMRLNVNPLPVYIKYISVEVNSDGVYYYDDIYGRDRILKEDLKYLSNYF